MKTDTKTEIKTIEKVEADSCCCTGKSWFHFFWSKDSASKSESHTVTPTNAPNGKQFESH